jgi:peptidoglycan/LPS O-acetylase OafA/YrhL
MQLPIKANKIRRYQSIDLWRGIACLMVLLFHGSFYVNDNPDHQASGGISSRFFWLFDKFWWGVPVFFVISGYCITAACDSAGCKSISVTRYFFRRFRRIYPPYLISVLGLFLGLFVASYLGFPSLFFDKIHPIHQPHSLSFSQWLGNLTLTESWRFHFVEGPRWYFLGPAWSLCYEEQFYAVCGILLFLRRDWFFRASVCLTCIVAVIALINHAVKPLPIDGFFFDGGWLIFSAGMLVYYRIHHGGVHFAKLAHGLLIGCLGLSAVWRYCQRTQLAEEIFIGSLFALVLSILFRWDREISGSRILRPVIACGTMCYSLYLIHWPVVKAVSHGLYLLGIKGEWLTLGLTLPLCLGAAVGVSWWFHILVERRFLNTAPSQRELMRTSSLPIPLGETVPQIER